jgi:hypothetical protein
MATLALLLPDAAPSPRPADRLAAELRRAYEAPARAGARWRRGAVVRTSDGREVPREEAWRDDPLFVEASLRLLASRARDDAPLGAWLLGTAAARRLDARAALVDSLGHDDPRAAFEAVQALAGTGDEGALEALARLAERSPSLDVRSAAAWAADQIRRREGAGPGAAEPLARGALPAGFRRGVSWWMSEGRADAGATSFRRLASLGVTWVSLHTWDPLQRGLDEPVLAEPDRHFGFRDLRGLVREAHAAGLRVMVKPHLEMRVSGRERLEHNRIAMRSEADWRTWFDSYAGYILPYAREAQEAGADVFCVGREIDTTLLRRDADWRALIARIRREFHGPLTYSANFDTWEGIRIWDALDLIGVSAYFPLTDRPDPTVAEIEAGWDRALASLEDASRRYGKPALLTEAGFPSIPSAAEAPWREERASADVWLQARCYEATLRALARHPRVEGAFFWLWERSAAPPFRDPSHAIVGKPASFALARWYRPAGRKDEAAR